MYGMVTTIKNTESVNISLDENFLKKNTVSYS